MWDRRFDQRAVQTKQRCKLYPGQKFIHGFLHADPAIENRLSVTSVPEGHQEIGSPPLFKDDSGQRATFIEKSRLLTVSGHAITVIGQAYDFSAPRAVTKLKLGVAGTRVTIKRGPNRADIEYLNTLE
ncbi:MAG: hypothetical protein RPU52_13850 [Candidatus Sedimenticola sp. (ex Thyasira tokunagai)]